MNTRRKKPRAASAVPIVLLGIAFWFAGECMGGWDRFVLPVDVRGRHIACGMYISPGAVVLRLGWSWPTTVWVPGHAAGDRVEVGHECFGFLLAVRGADFNGNPSAKERWYLLGIPWWFIVAILLAPRLERSARHRRAQRIREQRQTIKCVVCGYDLRATPERCPECGTVAGGRSGNVLRRR